MSNKHKEKAIEKMLLEYLDHRACFPCKIENTGIYDPRKKTFRTVTSPFKRKGISDIMFFYKGKVWYAEVKTPDELGYIMRNWQKLDRREVKSKERITNQIRFLQNVRQQQQVGIFIDGLDRLKDLMAQTPSTVPFY